jgi:hypothetical protein
MGAGGVFIVNAAADGAESNLVMIEPVRILDTRVGVDVGLAGPFVSPVASDLKVTGTIDTTNGSQVVVPIGATGVLLNVTAVRPTADGFISVRPANASGSPTTSNLNFHAGDIVPNAVTVGLPSFNGPGAGSIEITFDAFGVTGPTTDVLVDVVGYTTEAVSQPISKFNHATAAINLVPADAIVSGVSMSLPSAGQVIVTASAQISGNGNAATIRCSLTEQAILESGSTYSTEFETGGITRDNVAITRGFSVDGSSVFTANLVCDGFIGSAVIEAIDITAIYVPNFSMFQT